MNFAAFAFDNPTFICTNEKVALNRSPSDKGLVREAFKTLIH